MTKMPHSSATPSDRLELMQTFVRIVEAGSLSAAAAQMLTTQPTVSRRLQALERALGVRLLQRSTHAMKPTEDGERCYARAKELLADWDALAADLRGAGEAPEGLLRVVVPHAFGQAQLVEPLGEFLRACPRVDVEWQLRDQPPDFITQGIDCAVQVGEVNDPAVVAIGVRQSHIEALFFCFLAFAHGVSAVLRGAGRAQVPMYTMLGCWCILRVSYITLALKVWPDIATIFWAYPITWSVSCVVFLLYYLKADWVHALEKSL